MPAWPAQVDLRCVYGNQSDWSARTVVVPAAFREWKFQVSEHARCDSPSLKRAHAPWLRCRATRSRTHSTMNARDRSRPQLLDWLVTKHTLYVYQRSFPHAPCHCPNRGFEAGVYISFIAEHYDNLPAYTAFVQASAHALLPERTHGRTRKRTGETKTHVTAYHASSTG
jgi:hypothetical protein